MIRTSYVYKPSGTRTEKLEAMHSFLERCGIEASFSSVVDYCIDTTYEGDYEWDAAVFEKSFRKYLAGRREKR